MALSHQAKQLLPIHVIAEAQKKGGMCAIIDAEHAFDSSYAQKLGVDVDNLLISQPDYGEQGLEIADRLILSGALDVVVIDSVAAPWFRKVSWKVKWETAKWDCRPV